MNFDDQTLWSSNNNNTFKGDGIYINAIDEDFSLGGDFYYDKSEAQLGLSGQLLMDANGEITNTNRDFLIDADGIAFEEGTLGSQRLQWKESTFSTVRSEIYHNNHMIVDSENQFELRLDGTEEYNFNNNRLDLNVGTNKVLKLPHLTDGERDNFPAEEGDLIYNTTANGLQFYDGTNWVGS